MSTEIHQPCLDIGGTTSKILLSFMGEARSFALGRAGLLHGCIPPFKQRSLIALLKEAMEDWKMTMSFHLQLQEDWNMMIFQTQTITSCPSNLRLMGKSWDKPKLLECQLLVKIISALCSSTCGVAGDEKPEGCSSHTYVFAPSS